MFKAIGKKLTQYKWVVVVFWILLAAIIFWKAPSLSSVAKNDESNFLQSTAESFKAADLEKKLFPNKGDGASLVITLSKNSELTEEDKAYAKNLESYIKNNEKELSIKTVMSPFSDENLKNQLLSKNNRAALIDLELNVSSQNQKSVDSINSIRDAAADGFKLNSQLIKAPTGLQINVTGDAAFLTDENNMVNKSMNMITKITIVLVLVVLVLIYRSPVAPILPLLTIGLSFLISSGIVGALTKHGFKVSSYTEMFLIAVLFGAGTDYCLLLISRFKEELAGGKFLEEALISAMPNTAGSIISSGSTVLIGFLFMGFAKFGLFNTTGPSVAIGIAVTLLMVITLVPAFIAILGKKIFWPFHTDDKIMREANSNGVWDKIAKTVTMRAGMFIVIIMVLLLPFIAFNKNIVRSFDQISELPSSADSVMGFQVLKDDFNQGEMLPLEVVIKSNKNMWDQSSLSALDEVADKISQENNIIKVRTATRPEGTVLAQATISSQIEALSKGINDINGGINPMIDGIDEMHSGVKSVSRGLKDGGNKTKLLAHGIGDSKNGINQVNGGLSSMKEGQDKTISGLSQIYGGLDAAKSGVNLSAGGVQRVSGALNNTQKNMQELLKKYPTLAADPDFQTAYGTVMQSSDALNKINQGLVQVQGGLGSSEIGIKHSQDALSQISSGLSSSSAALNKIRSGLEQARNGQMQLANSLISASSDLNKLGDGFNPITAGLNNMGGGLDKVTGFTNEYSKNASGQFYLPSGTLEQYPELKDAMNYYIAPDGKGVTLDVELATQPYSNSSLDSVNEINGIVKDALKGTALEGSEFHIGGATATFNDIRDITGSDFINVMIIVLLGIFIVLAILLRSLTAPIYLLLTMILSYASTMGISYVVFQRILGYPGISWAVPFFTFCVLVALGIDYNIFLMARVKEEYTKGDNKGSVERAVASTGKIITSCGIIMAGTFGAMISASVRSMSEVGFATVVGLLLDTFIIRTLLVPAIAVKMGEFNWWPWKW